MVPPRELMHNMKWIYSQLEIVTEMNKYMHLNYSLNLPTYEIFMA